MKEKKLNLNLISEYKTSLYNDEKSKNTIEKYLRDICRFVEFTGDRIMEKSLVMEYKSKLKLEHCLTSANSMLAAVK